MSKSKNKVFIDKEQIMDVLSTALEGGSNYWYIIDDIELPKYVTELYMPSKKICEEVKKDSHCLYAELKRPIKVPQDIKSIEYKKFKEETGFHSIYDTILNNGKVKICDEDNFMECKPLNVNIIKEKLLKFAKNKKDRWNRIKNGKSDATDADIFLQEILWDKVVFG